MRDEDYSKTPLRLRFHKFLISALLLNLIGPAISIAPFFHSANAALSTSSNNCNTQYFPIESKWIPVRSSSGGVLTDPLNDVQGSGNLSNVDIYGTEATETATAGSAIDWYSTGTSGCFMFRMRVYAVATNSGGTSIDGAQWVVGLGTGSTAKAWMVVNGDSNGGGQVETYRGNFTDEKKYVFTSGVGTDSSTAWVNSVGSRHYVYWKVPYPDLISILGATTPYGIFAATTQSNNFSLAALNRDCLFRADTCQTFNFNSTAPVDITQNLSTTVAQPNITSLSVTKGTASGGTTVTIYGSNLTNSVRVLFGNSAATITSSYSDSVTVTTPSASVGSANVKLETAVGGFSNTLQNAFKYILAPTVTTDAATGISSSTARLNGSINAQNDDATTSFCWGTSSTLATCSGWETSTVTSIGTDTATVSVNLSGLSNSTTYYFRVRATNSLGSTFGSIDSFTTNTAALSITTTSPLASGKVGLDYSNQLQANGGTGTYSNWEISSGTLPSGLSMASTGLISGIPTTVGSSSNVVVKVTDSGGSTAFETYTVTIGAGPPSATTRPASSVATTSATLNGLVVANGADATISWCMSTDAATKADGSLFSCTQFSVSASPSLVAAADSITAITGSATSLTNNTIYYFQIKAVNSQGTKYGDILSFETNNRLSQSALTVVIGTASKTYPYSLGLSLSTTGGSTSGSVTYEIVPGGSADDCLLSNSSSSATITASTSGTCFIQGTMAGNATYNSVTSSSATFTFSKATLTVTPSSHTVGFGSTPPTITPSYSGFVNSETVDSPTVSSNLVAPSCTTTYTNTSAVGSSQTSSCSGGSARNYTLNTTGTGTVTVIDLLTQTVTFSDSSVVFTATKPRSLTGAATTNGNGAITYSLGSAGTAGCSVSANALSWTSGGSCTVSAVAASTSTYNASSSVTATFTISAASQTVTFPDSSVVVTATKPRSLTGAATTNGNGAITYSLGSAGTAGCSVSANALSWTSGGSCTVSAVAASTSTYNASSSVTATFTISAASQTVTFPDSSVVVTATKPRSLAGAASTNGNGAITFSLGSAGTAGCSVADNALSWTSAGSCTVSAGAASTTSYNASSSVTATFTITSTAATATTQAAEVLAKNRAKLKGESSGIDTDTAKFCFKTSSFSGKADCLTGGTVDTATVTTGSQFELDVSTLAPSTTYYVIFYGRSGGSDVAGSRVEFKTKPDVRTDTSTAVLARSAKLNATVSEALSSPKFCYKATSFTTLSNCLTGGSIDTATVVSAGPSLIGSTKTSKKSGIWSTFAFLKARVAPIPSEFSVSETTYALNVSGLTPSTTYYYIIYGTVGGAEYDGGVMNLTTLAEEAGGSGGSSESSGGSSGSSGGSSGSSGGSSGSSGGSAPTPGPTISSISKSLICFTGTELTISGSYFGGAIVTLDGNSANIRENSGSSIRVLLPSSAVGRRTITVTTSYGSAIAYIDYVSLPKPKYEPIRIPYLAQGDSIYLPFAATGALSYSLTGKLPQGLSFNTSTGLISGVVSENGIFIFTMVAEGCGETSQLVELDIDVPTPNAISHRINFTRNSCVIPDSAKASLERFLEKAKSLSPRNIIPEIYVSGGGKASDPNSPLADCRQEAICDFMLLENLLGEVLSDVFTGSENRIEIIVYWPRPNDGN